MNMKGFWLGIVASMVLILILRALLMASPADLESIQTKVLNFRDVKQMAEVYEYASGDVLVIRPGDKDWEQAKTTFSRPDRIFLGVSGTLGTPIWRVKETSENQARVVCGYYNLALTEFDEVNQKAVCSVPGKAA